MKRRKKSSQNDQHTAETILLLLFSWLFSKITNKPQGIKLDIDRGVSAQLTQTWITDGASSTVLLYPFIQPLQWPMNQNTFQTSRRDRC